MASTRRKAAAVAIAVVGVAGLSLAAAAQLTVNNTTLQAGTTTIDAACDADGVVAMDYDYAFNATSDAYELTAVNVTGIDAACVGSDIEVTLIDEADAVVTLASKDVVAGTTSWTAAATELGAATIGSIFDVAVVIHS